MYQIQLLNKISPVGLSVLDPAQYACSDSAENPVGIVVRSASLHEMALSDSLLAVARAGAGTNNIPIDRCTERGIVVFNTPGGNANAVKELTLTGLLLSARKIFPAMQWVQTLKGEGDAVAGLAEKGKGNYVGPELAGKALGVVGLGAIGMLVANAALALGMRVYGYDPFLPVQGAWKLDPRIRHAATLEDIYRESDFLSLHLPVNAETKGMICAATIARMKKPVRIVNFARGDLVNNTDLLAALDGGDVACYVTDFACDELLGHPAVVTMPHLGASTPESEDNCAEMAAAQLRDYLENGNVRNAVNLPGLEVSREGGERVCVIHKNDPNLLAAVTACFAAIDGTANATRGDIAYTIVDAPSVNDAVADKLKALDGVLRVRIIR